MILDIVTKLLGLPDCPEYFSYFPQVVKDTKRFRTLLNAVTKFEDLPELSKYFSDFPQVRIQNWIKLQRVS